MRRLIDLAKMPMSNNRRALPSNRTVLVMAVLTLSLAASRSDGDTDLSGIWYPESGSTSGWPEDRERLTPAGVAVVENWVQDEDPVMGCIIGFGRIVSAPIPMEILHNQGRVTILYEFDHQVRRIFMDGRDHPEDLYPSWMGHSLGRWDEDTLVIETMGLEAGVFRPQGGLPYSEAVRVTERYSLMQGGRRLGVELTIEDPTYYTKPWTVTWQYAPGKEILEYTCIVRSHVAPTAQ